MHRPKIAVSTFGLLLASALCLVAASLPSLPKHQQITPKAVGPFHVSGKSILDSRGREFVLRGTQLTDFHPQTAEQDNRAGEDFGPHSATILSAIRLRFNMNAVRLPVNVLESNAPEYFSKLARVVERANQVDLLVVLSAREPGAGLPSPRTAEFWIRCAAYFKDYPNVIFDVFSDPSPAALPAGAGDPHSLTGWAVWRKSMQGLVSAIRAAGGAQPIVISAGQDDRLFESAEIALLDDPNIIYEPAPRFASTRSDAQRDAHFSDLAIRVPVIANGLDLELDNPAACGAIPSDPSAAAAMVESTLEYFDSHGISWIVSVFQPGKLIRDLSSLDPTTLDNGWTCGSPRPASAGMGLLIAGHMRATDPRGLFVVGASGGPDLPRGGFSLAYGPVLAAYDAQHIGPQLPRWLGRLSVQITDSLGVTRPAGMLWASAGWGQTNFVMPEQSAPGPAVMTIERADGTHAASLITIADTAPGFLTGVSCRGPALGIASVIFPHHQPSASQISSCAGIHCRTVPIPMPRGATTRVRLITSGFRHASSAQEIDVNIDGFRAPVVSYGATKDPGLDFLIIEIPDSLRGRGETDLVAHVNGRLSNAVRISFGGEKPAL